MSIRFPLSRNIVLMLRHRSSFRSIYVKPSVQRQRGHRDLFISILKVLRGRRLLIGKGTLKSLLKKRLPSYRRSDQRQKRKKSQRLSNFSQKRNALSLWRVAGVTASDARAELLAFAEKLSIPVATSLNAKAMFPSDHPLAVGTPGSYSRACANQAVCEADLVFFIGSHTGGQVTNGYKIPPQGTPIIQLDINPDELGRNYPIQLGMQGDVRNTLRRMLEAAETTSERTEWVGVACRH